MKKLVKISLLALIATVSINASEMGAKELFDAKCAICHKTTMPKDQNSVIAPMAQGVMFHMREALKDDAKIKAHIEDFVINPSKEKAICQSVNRFGLMPSQKGVVTKEELSKIADYMVKTFNMTPQGHKKMQQGMQKGKQNMFNQIDTNKDGKISKDELVAKKGFMANIMFSRIDANDDGFISKEEFLSFRGKKGKMQ